MTKETDRIASSGESSKKVINIKVKLIRRERLNKLLNRHGARIPRKYVARATDLRITRRSKYLPTKANELSALLQADPEMCRSKVERKGTIVIARVVNVSLQVNSKSNAKQSM